MNEFFSTWLFDLGRVTLVLTGVALAVGIALRLTRPTTPLLHRTAWCMVLLVGWLFVRYPVSIPWYESAPVDLLAGSPATDNLPDPSQATGLTTVGLDAYRQESIEEPVAKNLVPLLDTAEMVPIEPIAPQVPQVQAEIELTASIPDKNLPTPLATPTPLQSTAAAFHWATVLLFIWLAGIVVSLFRWLSGYVRSIRSMSTALQPDEASCRHWQALLKEQKIDREIPLRLTENMGPLLCRWPDGYELVVPAKFWESLPLSARLGVMRHELAHYQRGDVWKSMAIRILALPHWFNPAAWWAVRRFEEAAEWACDEAAIGEGARSTDYARTLLALAESSLGGGSCHPSMSRWNLSARIRRLVASPNRKDSLMKKTTLASLAILLLVFCLVRIDLVAKTPVAVKPSPPVAAKPSQKREATSTDEPLATTERDVTRTPGVLPTPKTKLRYDDKTFEEWKETLATELSVAIRVDAIKAMAAFGARGYGKEAVEVIASLMRESGGFIVDGTERTRLLAASIAAFSGQEGQVTMADTISVAEGIPVLLRELKEGNRKSQGFVLFTLFSMNYHHKEIEDATPALAEFIRNHDGEVVSNEEDSNYRDWAFQILLSADPTGKTTAAILREEFAKTPSKYPETFVELAIPKPKGLFRGLSKELQPVNDISPGQRGAALAVSECLDADRPTSIRHAAMLDLARFLASFDKEGLSLSGGGGMMGEGEKPRPISNETFQFGQEMMDQLITAYAKELKQNFKIYQILRTYAPKNSRVHDMAEHAWTEAYKAALENPSDAHLAKREQIAMTLYWVLGAKSSSPDTQKRECHLVYQLGGAFSDPANMKKNVAVVKRRVQSVVSSAVVTQSGRQEISVHLVENNLETVERIDQILSQLGTLELRILANHHDHKKLIEQAEKEKGTQVLDKQGKRLAWWVPVEDQALEEVTSDESKTVTRKVKYDEKNVTEVLVVNDPYNITDRLVSQAEGFTSPMNQKPMIQCALNKDGGFLLEKLTRENLPNEEKKIRRRLGLIHNGKLCTAPTIMSTITGGNFAIMGNFTEEKAKELAFLLNVGSLPTPLERISWSSFRRMKTPPFSSGGRN